LANNLNIAKLRAIVVKINSEKKPLTIKELVGRARETTKASEDEILRCVLNLRAEGVIRLEDKPSAEKSAKENTCGLKITIVIGVIAALTTFAIPESMYPWAYIRNFVGIVFVLFLPGYAFVKVFLEQNFTIDKASKDIEAIEQIALSIGSSIALVSLVGLLLYYSPWGLNLETSVLTISAITLSLGAVGIIRINKMEKH
jgi:uncharacterized membrane protein